jgi:hypothetical protein
MRPTDASKNLKLRACWWRCIASFTPSNAEQAIEFEAIPAAATEVGLYELGWVDIVLRPVLTRFIVVCLQ